MMMVGLEFLAFLMFSGQGRASVVGLPGELGRQSQSLIPVQSGQWKARLRRNPAHFHNVGSIVVSLLSGRAAVLRVWHKVLIYQRLPSASVLAVYFHLSCLASWLKGGVFLSIYSLFKCCQL